MRSLLIFAIESGLCRPKFNLVEMDSNPKLEGSFLRNSWELVVPMEGVVSLGSDQRVGLFSPSVPDQLFLCITQLPSIGLCKPFNNYHPVGPLLGNSRLMLCQSSLACQRWTFNLVAEYLANQRVGSKLALDPASNKRRLYLDLLGYALLNLRAFWPRVLRIASHQFSSNLRVEALPKSREVRSRLDGAMIWSEQMDDERCPIRANPRSVEHPEEILKAGRDPRWSALVVMNFSLTSIPKANA